MIHKKRTSSETLENIKEKKRNKIRNRKRIKAIKSKVHQNCGIEKEFPFCLIFPQRKITTKITFNIPK